MTATMLDTVSQNTARRASKTSKYVIAGRIISGIAVAFMAMDTSMKLFHVKQAVEGTVQMGFTESVMLPLGIIQLVSLVLYLVPRTAAFGALMFTGYLGGAVCMHVLLKNPVFTHMLFPIYVAIFLWGGLFLRDVRIRAALGFSR